MRGRRNLVCMLVDDMADDDLGQILTFRARRRVASSFKSRWRYRPIIIILPAGADEIIARPGASQDAINACAIPYWRLSRPNRQGA